MTPCAPAARLLTLAASLAAILAAFLAGCGALDPYPTVPPEPTAGLSASPMATPARVAICYNTLTTTLAEVARQAQEECPAATRAEPADTDYHLQNCPLLLPARATFLCLPRK